MLRSLKKAKKTFRIIIAIVTAIIICIAVSDHARAAQKERYYQDQWCAGKGRSEVVMSDRTRCDCLTADNAIEFDFGKKWAEAVGQSLHYSLQTGKRAGIVLILKKPKDRRYWVRLNSLILHHNLPIDTWALEGWK